ncbi:MAG: lysylphosphatidylglycerol synthase transmembrane domain-containing protein [Bacteroidales bacterium]|nr:lysylphosphatidylglycerol synthase transmembrane domain-containing protein [Bacteroidales bacterium]
MKKSFIQILKIAGFLALGILLLYFAFRGVAFDELARTLQRVNFSWIGLSLIFAGISFFSRARRWMLLIEPLGFKPSFKNTYHSVMVGYLSNYALPRLGEVTRCITLGKKEKIPVDSLIGTVIIERVIDVIMLLLIMLVLLISWMDKFGGFLGEQVWSPLQQKFTGLFGGTWVFWVLALAAFLLLFLLIYLFRKSLARFSLVQKIKKILKGLLEGLKTIYRMKRKWEFVLHSILIWFLYIMMTWVVVFALEELSGLSLTDGMFLLVIGGLGMSAPVTAGFGAYHWITSRGLMFVYGFSLETGSAYAILAHESNSLLTILLGAISYSILMISRKRTSKSKNES